MSFETSTPSAIFGVRFRPSVFIGWHELLKLLLLVLYLVFVSGPQFSLAGTKLFYFQISVRRGFKGRDMLLLLAVIAA
jgi:hypothetical protein